MKGHEAERESRELAAQSTDVRMRLREHKEWTTSTAACMHPRSLCFLCVSYWHLQTIPTLRPEGSAA